jgi:hypothetical protein
VVNRKPRVQTPIVSHYPASTPVGEFVLLFLPPCGPHLILFVHWVHRAEPTCLSTPRRSHMAKTFCARSSPAPTQIRPQPTRAILGQESVHTMLSITHRTWERPSTDRRTLRSSISPLMSALTTHIVTNPEKREKEKTRTKHSN